MRRILSDILLDEATLRRLEALTGAAVQVVPYHERGWELEDELLRGPEILLCKLPPRNLDRMADVKLIQLSTVGYEHLRGRGFADKPLRICNARGILDTAIGEGN